MGQLILWCYSSSCVSLSTEQPQCGLLRMVSCGPLSLIGWFCIISQAILQSQYIFLSKQKTSPFLWWHFLFKVVHWEISVHTELDVHSRCFFQNGAWLPHYYTPSKIPFVLFCVYAITLFWHLLFLVVLLAGGGRLLPMVWPEMFATCFCNYVNVNQSSFIQLNKKCNNTKPLVCV